jgi:hypothetical protein
MNHALIVDCETVAIDAAADYLEPASAPSNYKDEGKIAAYIDQANREALNKAALDIDLGRIVALGLMGEAEHEPTVWLAHNEADEKAILTRFWAQFLAHKRPTLIGFNCIGYDLPLMVRRSLYLGVKTPPLQIGKYRHDGIVDLMLSLSFDGLQKYRGLSFYTNRFGIDVPDESTGKDVAGLVAAGDWQAVTAHCRADVLRTAALARRMGVLSPEAVAV